MATEWIDPAEKMPEEYELVLVWFEYYRGGEYDDLFRDYGLCFTIQGEWSRYVNGASGWRQLRIIAWMPLPDPPEGATDDER